MPLTALPRPQWLTFDCYGTLIQWDEGLQAAIARILAGPRRAARCRRRSSSCTSTMVMNIGSNARRRTSASPTSRGNRCA